MEENEIQLFNFVQVIWKRKWIIILGTIASMLIAGIASFLFKPVYEIDAIIQPGKFIIQNQSGNFDEVIVETPKQIADKVKHESYNFLIAAELGIDEWDVPKINGEYIKDTILTRIWIRNHDIELSKNALRQLINILKEDIDKKISIEITNIDTQIKSRESEIRKNEIAIESRNIEIERLKQEIIIIKNKLKIINKRKGEIVEEIKEVKKRIVSLEKNQADILKKTDKSEGETLGLLLYSNEVQQNLRNFDRLQEELSLKELNTENTNLEIESKTALIMQTRKEIESLNNDIEKIKDQIANLTEQKGRIDFTKIIKKPTHSRNPIFPRKKFIVLCAGIFGSFIFILIAMFFEFIEKQKTKE